MGLSSTGCPVAQLSSAQLRPHAFSLEMTPHPTAGGSVPQGQPPPLTAPLPDPSHRFSASPVLPSPPAADHRSLQPPAQFPCFPGAAHGRKGFLKKMTKDIKGCESVARGGGTWGEHAKDHLTAGAGAGAATRAHVLVPQPATLQAPPLGLPWRILSAGVTDSITGHR